MASVLLNAGPALAISPTLRKQVQYDAPWYSESAKTDGCSAGSNVPNSVNLPQPTVLAINALKDIYVKVGQAKGVPWQMLAAVDYRESKNGRDASALDGSKLGTPNKDHPNLVPKTKEESVDLSANYLRDLAKGVYGVEIGPNNTPDQIKQAFLSYNRGALYKNAGLAADLSPYVMNMYNGVRLSWPNNSAAEPLAGRGQDANLGAFTVYSALTGVAACGGSSGNKIVDIARQELARGVQELPPGSQSNNAPDINKYKGLDPNGSGDSLPWCASFVSWVYNAAGTPLPGDYRGWLITYVPSLHNHLAESGVYTTREQNAFPPEPGDVIIIFSAGTPDGHTGIIVEVNGNNLNTIEGNASDAVRARTYENYLTNPKVSGWGRLK